MNLEKNSDAAIKAITNYLNSHPRVNLQNVAIKTGVSYSSVSRIMKKTCCPTLDVTLKILLGLGEKERIADLINEVDSDTGKLLQTYKCNQEYSFIDKNFESYFADEDYFLILNLAYTRAGTNREEIRDELGKKGVRKLDELIEKKLVTVKGEKVYGQKDKFRLPLNITKDRIQLALKYYRVKEAGAPHTWISFQTESIDKKGLEILKQINQEAFTKRKEMVFDNPERQGSIKVFSASFSSTFQEFNDNNLH